MKLLFSGHDDRYDIEQDLLAFFPDERPVYDPQAQEAHWASVKLFSGQTYTTATACIHFGGKVGRGLSRMIISPALSPYEQEGLRRRLLKLSFFKASVAVLGYVPVWGSLTGVRPAKVAARLLTQGLSPAKVDRVLDKTYLVSPQRRKLCIEAAEAGLAAKAALAPNDISLYVGIPFCPTRCAYCSFVSQSVEKSFDLMEPYLASLMAEMTLAGEMVQKTGLSVRSFYMGGGTPTTLSASQLDRLLTHLRRCFDLSHVGEFCIEAGRPDTITPEKLQVLRTHGTDRISVNPQSLSDAVLHAIGRRHTADDVRQAMAQVRTAGFRHVNMDLIAGLPADRLDTFRATLDECLAMGADNITVHTLAMKKGSRLTLEGTAVPDASTVAAMLDYADPTLRRAGFGPYYLYRQKYMSGSFENVGWCISGAEGLYNIYIMEELHSILALGAGGSTKMVDVKGQRIERLFHPKYPAEYIQRPEQVAANLDAFAAFHREMLG